MAVVAVADSTGLSQAVYNDVTPEDAQLGSGGEELPVGLAFDVQDYSLVQEGETKATLEAGLLVLNKYIEHCSMLYAIVELHNYTSFLLTLTSNVLLPQLISGQRPFKETNLWNMLKECIKRGTKVLKRSLRLLKLNMSIQCSDVQ